MRLLRMALVTLFVVGGIVTIGWQTRTIRAETATPAARTVDRVLLEVTFPAGSVGGERAEVWLNQATLGGGLSAPFPGSGMTQPGVALLIVQQGNVEVSGSSRFEVISSRSARATPVPAATPIVLNTGDAAAISFGPNTAFEVRNPGSEPARLVSGIVFGDRSPAGGPPPAFEFVDASGPMRLPVSASGAPVVRLDARGIEAGGILPAPGPGAVQLAIGGPGAVAMRHDGSARNVSNVAIEAIVLTVGINNTDMGTPVA